MAVTRGTCRVAGNEVVGGDCEAAFRLGLSEGILPDSLGPQWNVFGPESVCVDDDITVNRSGFEEEKKE